MTHEDEDRIIDGIQRRIQYQLQHTWHNLITTEDKDRFLSNFSGEKKICGYVLLDMLLFHNQAQEKQLISTLYRKLKSDIYRKLDGAQKKNAEEIEEEIEKELEQAAFIPVGDKNSADSSYCWTTMFREVHGSSSAFFTMEELPILLAMHRKYIVFFDDVLGSGQQLSNVLDNQRYRYNDKYKVSILDLMKCNKDVKYYYLCLAGFSEGLKKLSGEEYHLNVIASERFEEEDSILAPENEYWASYSEDERNTILSRLSGIIDSTIINNPDSNDGGAKYTRNLSVMFERNRPSNTSFPLYWYIENNWSPLKARERR